MTKIYMLQVPERLESGRLRRLERYVSREKKERLARFRQDADVSRTLFADLLIRRLIMSGHGLRNDEIRFDAGPFGKPSVIGLPGFEFNLSHAGNRVVCAVGNQQIGVDIERIAPIEFGIAQQFFAREEYEQLLRAEPGDRLTLFYELWTIKESYIKMTGRGLQIPLDSFRVCRENDGIALYEQQRKLLCRARNYEVGDEYKLTLCTTSDFLPDAPLFCSAEELETAFD
ncbi:4'-phosphopantetheinyl transferase family protein [Saccharibacillus sacchari]|uniref:4'-phosphopantetheinyl transferase superfamily protein n=1 Tax=Saccharibacillus sacchari TaxID=456493 RepID=A0ACC6PET9_9BACL